MKPGPSILAVILVLLTPLAALSADPVIHLKRRSFEAPADLEAHRVGPLLRHRAGRSHFLIQFQDRPSPEQIRELQRRGVRIMSYVPDAALVVSASDNATWSGLGLRYAGRLDALDKLSPALSPDISPDGSGGVFVVVEFQPDADMNEARALVSERNLQILDRSNLTAAQLLVDGSLDDITRLADWDEVAYIFPASTELVNGDAVYPCAGALTELGPIADYVLASTGWPRTGEAGSPVALHYVFGQMPSEIAVDTAHSEVLRALAVWAANANVSFSPGQSAADPRTLNIFFASGAHGDAYPFSSAAVMAHTFYPAPPNSEPIAGDMHFNLNETWRVGATTDLFSVALHEAGHALGLAHTDNPNAVMYPYYKFNTTLSADDIAGAVALYGAAQNNTNGSSTSPAPVPPAPTPTPAPAVAITITSPANGTSTNASTATIAGIASGGSGSLTVSWTSDRGGSGATSGAANWLILGASLASGANHITVIATDSAGKTASQTILITSNSAPGGPVSGTADSTPPSLQILSPGAAMVLTSAPAINLTGVASDNVGVAAVKWSNSFGQGGVAQGTSSWQIPNIPLLEGTNKITVTAYDGAGNSAWRLITVVRQ